MCEEEAELATLSENACRNNAKPTDRLLMLRGWQDAYKKYFPHLEGKKASGNSRWSNSTKAEAKQAAVDAEKAQDAAEVAKSASEDLAMLTASTTKTENEPSDRVTVEVEVTSHEGTESEGKPVRASDIPRSSQGRDRHQRCHADPRSEHQQGAYR